jgi:hypothetical protein
MEKQAESNLRNWLRQVDYVLLDAARSPEIAPAIMQQADAWLPLWDVGEEAAELLTVSPYLVRWQPRTDFAEWLLQNGWGQSWGVFLTLRVQTPLEQLRRHCQSLLLVQVENEPHHYYFRFYDPRVLRVFLETCTLEQAQQFFGPVRAFLCEGANQAEMILYELKHTGVEHKALRIET